MDKIDLLYESCLKILIRLWQMLKIFFYLFFFKLTFWMENRGSEHSLFLFSVIMAELLRVIVLVNIHLISFWERNCFIPQQK